MSFVSRGFHGRRDSDADPRRVPPGQYVTHGLPGALGRPDAAHAARPSGTSRSSARSTSRAAGRWDEFRALPSEEITRDIHCVTKWSKLDTVLARASRSTRCSTGSRPPPSTSSQFSDGGYTTNLPLEDVTGGKAWVAFELRRRAARARARRPGAAARAAPLLLEEREVGARAAAAGGRRAGLLGDQRLPQLRRSVAGAAVLGRLTLAARRRRRASSPRRRASRPSPSTCPAGRGTAPGSTSTSG